MNFLDEYRSKVRDELQFLLQKGSTPLFGLDSLNCYHMGFCDREGKPTDGAKGKYLRPLSCIAMCAGLGGDPEQAVPAGAALELTHRTSLVFDDIQDKGTERNNQPTVWAIWGSEQAINAGLALSCYARLAIHRLSARGVPDEKILGIHEVLENAVIELCLGQYMDISFVDSTELTVEDYLKMIRGKTAALFAACCTVGAILASARQSRIIVPGIPVPETSGRDLVSERVLTHARQFGISIGMAFQIHDDYLGVWGEEGTVGKTANDLLERKRSLPVVMAIEKYPEPMADILTKKTFSQMEADLLKASLERHGIKGQVVKLEGGYIRQARRHLKTLALVPEWNAHFEELLGFLSERKA